MDAINEGRHKAPETRRGENSKSAILTQAQVNEIRQAIERRENQTLLAKTYGVHKTTISAIKHGRLWNN